MGSMRKIWIFLKKKVSVLKKKKFDSDTDIKIEPWFQFPITNLLYIMYMNYECSTLPASVNNIDCRIEKESEADKRFPGFEQFSICTIQTQCKFLLHKIANSPQLFAWERSIVMFDGFGIRRNVRFYNKASFNILQKINAKLNCHES